MLKFDDRGLMPAIIQDDDSGEVLTLFWMNDEAVRKTLESRQVWRYSRQHRELMLKGATSGNYLNVRRSVRIGLLPDVPREKYVFLGNTSLAGARLAGSTTRISSR